MEGIESARNKSVAAPAEARQDQNHADAQEVFKDMHMTGRAMRIDETLVDYKKERESSWPTQWEKIQKERGWVVPEAQKPGRTAEGIDAAVPPEKKELARQLETMTQDQYAEWLSQNMPEESDLYNQIVVRPEYRSLLGKERADFFLSIKDSPQYEKFKKSITELDQFWLLKDKLKGNSGIRTVGTGSSWNNFEINQVTVGHSESKGYLTFVDPVASLTPQNLSVFMEKLRDAGYNGQVKVPTLPSGLLFRFDNLVFHGNTDEDTQKAMQVAKELFKNEISQTQVGKDGENSKGERKSHSELLAEKVELARKAKKA